MRIRLDTIPQWRTDRQKW